MTIIPPPLTADGEVADAFAQINDVRVPKAFVGHGDAHVVDLRACPAGRHAWDLLMSIGNYRDSDDEARPPNYDARLTATCIHCGVIWRAEGSLADQQYDSAPSMVQPEPLKAGGLLAQEVGHDTWYLRKDRGQFCTYAVHATTGERVGSMRWGRTARGRHFYTGHLDVLPRGAGRIEAPTAIACLRKLAKAHAEDVA